MECISQETVDKTWKTVAQLPPETAAQSMFEFSEAQPNLLGFVMSFAEDLESDANELCTYMLYVVYQMFANSGTGTLPQITEAQIEAQYKSTCEMLDKLHDTDDSHGEGLEVEVENQPHVYQYVSDALFAEEVEEDDLNVSDDDAGEVFMMMKCVIDALDKATG